MLQSYALIIETIDETPEEKLFLRLEDLAEDGWKLVSARTVVIETEAKRWKQDLGIWERPLHYITTAVIEREITPEIVERETLHAVISPYVTDKKE